MTDPVKSDAALDADLQELQRLKDEGLTLGYSEERFLAVVPELRAALLVAQQDRDDFAHGAWGSSAATIVALKHRSEQAEEERDVARGEVVEWRLELERAERERDEWEKRFAASNARVTRAEATVTRLREAIEQALVFLDHPVSRSVTLRAQRVLSQTRALTQDAEAEKPPILSDKNPSAVVGVPWNEHGYVPPETQDAGAEE